MVRRATAIVIAAAAAVLYWDEHTHTAALALRLSRRMEAFTGDEQYDVEEEVLEDGDVDSETEREIDSELAVSGIIMARYLEQSSAAAAAA